MTIAKRLWSEDDDFVFHGRYYTVSDAYAMPSRSSSRTPS
jgi:hypothetical protein